MGAFKLLRVVEDIFIKLRFKSWLLSLLSGAAILCLQRLALDDI